MANSANALKNIQHKKEAWWFYRFLSIFYDDYVNPFFWTTQMRSDALELVQLDSPDLLTLDAGSGTGFTTQGIARHVDPKNITCIDQSPHQMQKAKKKADLQGCTFLLGDAENLPVENGRFDRYVSAGSIEYWPNPQQGVAEAHRVLKPGGVALIIGPLRPKHWLSRFLADTWMLFPEEEEYVQWFKEAGFIDVEKRYVMPDWILREQYGIAIAGTKPENGSGSARPQPKIEEQEDNMTLRRSFSLVKRLAVGSLAGFVFIPIAIFGKIRLHTLRLLGVNNTNPAVRKTESS